MAALSRSVLTRPSIIARIAIVFAAARRQPRGASQRGGLTAFQGQDAFCRDVTIIFNSSSLPRNNSVEQHNDTATPTGCCYDSCLFPVGTRLFQNKTSPQPSSSLFLLRPSFLRFYHTLPLQSQLLLREISDRHVSLAISGVY